MALSLSSSVFAFQAPALRAPVQQPAVSMNANRDLVPGMIGKYSLTNIVCTSSPPHVGPSLHIGLLHSWHQPPLPGGGRCRSPLQARKLPGEATTSRPAAPLEGALPLLLPSTA